MCIFLYLYVVVYHSQQVRILALSFFPLDFGVIGTTYLGHNLKKKKI